MELTPSVIISAIVAFIVVVSAFVGIVFWFARLEGKTTTNSTDITDIYRQLEVHSQDRQIHHDGDELNRRFSAIDVGMQTIQKGIDKLNDRFDRLLNK
jgi:hypothetical protein